MTALSRTKGQAGEREVAAVLRNLAGWDIRRRVRQHEGDSDVEGIPGWCCEVKRHARAVRADLRCWWAQTERQAVAAGGLRPVLFYRLDRDEWRAMWPVAAVMAVPDVQTWGGYGMTVEGSIQAWVTVARECTAALELVGA